jgi:uncharacterized protein involved in exopolysaccharide biosynthesis
MDHQQRPHLSKSNTLEATARVQPSTAALVRLDNHAAPAYNVSSASDDDDAGGNIVEYWRLLVRHKRTLLLGSLAGLAIGFAVGIPLKSVFRAETSLEVLTINGDFMNEKQSNPTTTNDGNYDTSEEETQAKLLQSNALLERVIDKLDPSARVVSHPKPATSGWRSWLHLPEEVTLSKHAKLVLKAADSLKVRPAARTRV